MNITGALKDKLYNKIAARVGSLIEYAIDNMDVEDLIDDDYITDCISDALAVKISDYARGIVDDIVEDVVEDLEL